MRTMPGHIVDLIRRLDTAPTIFARLAGQAESKPDIIRELGETRCVDVVSTLAAFLFESHDLSSAAIDAIGQVMPHATAQDLCRLDEQLRSQNVWWGSQVWRDAQPDAVAGLDVPEHAAAAVYGVLSSHPRGYIREAAVTQLARIHSGAELPFLLLRLNDWVAKIHDAALAAIESRLESEQFDDFMANLDLVFRLEECRRYDHTAVVSRVIKALASPDYADQLATALRSASRTVRRRTYRATVEFGGADATRVIRQCLRSDDGVLRLWATRDAKFLLADKELQEALPAVLDDRFLPVRRESLLCVMARFPDQTVKWLTLALLDQSRSLREFARFHLRKAPDVDIANYYRENLNRPDTLRQAIVGLGETGHRGDEQLVFNFLLDRRPSIRAATIRCIGLLSKGWPNAILFDAIQDDSKQVVLEACNALAQSIDVVELSRLGGILRNEVRTGVLMSVLDLVDRRETWDAMPYLVEATASRNSEVADAAMLKIRSKVNHVYTSPTATQRELIQDALHHSDDAMPSEFAAEFANWLETRG